MTLGYGEEERVVVHKEEMGVVVHREGEGKEREGGICSM